MANDVLKLEGFDEAFGTDSDLERDGAWVPVPGSAGRRIRLRSSDSALVRDKAAKIARRHQALYRVNKTPDAVELDKDKVELLSTTIVSGWEGFDNLACNPGTIRRVMEAYPKFRDYCIQMSDAADNYRKAQVEEMEGNSEQPSPAS